MRMIFVPLILALGLFLVSDLQAQDAKEVSTSERVVSRKALKVLETAPRDDDTIIDFPKGKVTDFLNLYEKLKEVTLIKDASIEGDKELSLTTYRPVSKAEAIRLLESTLLLNGYAFIAVDKNSIKVINTLGGKSPRSEGVFLFTNESELPEGGYCFLRHAIDSSSCQRCGGDL